MANPSGWQALGNVLGGGIDREGAYLQGRYRSAQTEEALAAAREKQAQAIKQERTNQIIDDLRVHTPDFNNPANTDLASMIVAGLGSDFSAAMTGRKTGQEVRLRDDIVNPGTDYSTVQRDRAALGNEPFNPLHPVGTQGAFVDTRAPDKGVQPPIGEELIPGEPTPAIRNYEYDQNLLKQGKNPSDFRRMVRNDQIVTAGGVPYSAGFGGGGPAKAVVSPDQTASNAGNVAGAKTTAQGLAKRTLDLPRAQSAMASSDANWDSLTNAAKTLQSDENLWKAVGLGKPISSIPGTDGARIRAQINTLKTKAGFSVLQDMRANSKTGGALGNISDRENEYLQNALAALDANLAPEDFREQLQILIDYANGAKQRVHGAFDETYPELKTGGAGPSPATTVPGVGPGAQPAANDGTIRYVRGADGKLHRAQ